MKKLNNHPWVHDEKYCSNPGTKTVPEYVLDFPESGGLALKQVGEKPIYEIIQANKANCDLANVIESCVHSNQYTACTPDTLNTMIADFTGLTNLGDLYTATKRMENTWKDLPLEVRESFGSDIKQFIRGIGTDDFKSKVTDGFNKYGDTLFKSKNPEVKSNANDFKAQVDQIKNIENPSINVKETIESGGDK